MQVKQIYKDVVTLVEGDNVFHLDSGSVLRNEVGSQLMTNAVLSQNATGERDLPLDQERGV
jgi:hypothetical protein